MQHAPTCSGIKQHRVPSQKAWLHTSVVLLGSMSSGEQASHSQPDSGNLFDLTQEIGAYIGGGGEP